jgi:hypothetical protein
VLYLQVTTPQAARSRIFLARFASEQNQDSDCVY